MKFEVRNDTGRVMARGWASDVIHDLLCFCTPEELLQIRAAADRRCGVRLHRPADAAAAPVAPVVWTPDLEAEARAQSGPLTETDYCPLSEQVIDGLSAGDVTRDAASDVRPAFAEYVLDDEGGLLSELDEIPFDAPVPLSELGAAVPDDDQDDDQDDTVILVEADANAAAAYLTLAGRDDAE